MSNCNSEIYWELIVNGENPVDGAEIEHILGFDLLKPLSEYFRRTRSDKRKIENSYYWCFTTPTVMSVNPEDEISPLLDVLSIHLDELSEYIIRHNLSVIFYLVTHYHSGLMPNLRVSRKFIDICYKLNAEIEEDSYSDSVEDESIVLNGEELKSIKPASDFSIRRKGFGED